MAARAPVARSGGGVHVEGLSDFLAGIRRVDKEAATVIIRELDKRIEAAILPEIKARTPVGSSRSHLRDATKVTTARSQIAFENRKPYANAIHWGRLFWPNSTGGSRGERVPSKIDPSRFMYGPLTENEDMLAQVAFDAIEHAIFAASGIGL